jgi:ABC-type bacteriocin/lantibiotic exporter with double-glycine peptidase domain
MSHGTPATFASQEHTMPLVFHHVSFAYDGSPFDVVRDLSAHFPVGWTGVVGANGVGKSTILQLAVGLLEPTDGAVQGGRRSTARSAPTPHHSVSRSSLSTTPPGPAYCASASA